MSENTIKGPKKDAAKIMTEFRKKKQEKPAEDLLKKALQNWPEKNKNEADKKIAQPDAEV